MGWGRLQPEEKSKKAKRSKKAVLFGFGWLEIILVLVAAAGLFWFFSPSGPPTIAQYVADRNGKVAVLQSGEIIFNGVAASCNNAPIVLDDSFEDHAAAWPSSGFIIVNRKFMDPLPEAQQLFTFYHECGHMNGHVAELDADCYSIKRGHKSGWLDEKGLEQLCAYWRPKKGDKKHPPGPVRCKHMIECFNAKPDAR